MDNLEPQQPAECCLCHGSKQVLQYPKRTMGYTLTEGETLDEHFVPCPGCIEPQQPEGELVDACQGCAYGQSRVCSEADKSDCARWDLAKAQLAHNKATMVKLPSEDELAIWLCDHPLLSYRGLSKALREWLEVKP